MANAEASPGNLGPRYAPDDPTLPEPWKGLIDGSTGSMYYWNPETNITQYEKPASLAPSLSHGPPPAVSTPKMNPLPSQPDGVQTPQNQHMSSSYYQQSQVGPTTQQPGQVRPQMMQQPSQHMPLQSGQQFPMHQTPYQQMQQMPHVQQGQMYPGAQMGSQHGFQFPGQHTQYMGYQQNMPQQGQQSSSQQMPHIQEYKMEHGQRDDKDFHQVKQQGFSQAHRNSMQGQHYPHPQDQKSGIPQRDNVEFQQGNQPGFSPAQIQQTGMPSASLPAGANSHIQPNRTVEYNASSANVQQNKSSLTHLHHGSMFQNQLSSGIIRGQQQNLPPAGSKMLHEEIHHGRPGNEYSYNNSKNVNAMSPQLPKLAALPTNRNQLEVKVGDFPSQNPMPSLPGRLNGPGGHALPVYDNYSGPPSYQNNAFVRPPVAMMRPSDPIHLSSADYRQKHEVTVTGENVPAPFMSFEDTGFPPEILYELRDAGFSAPTPIQAQSWPIAIQNRDIVAIAKTGSGKTLGYMIPAFIHLSRRRNNPQHGPTVIVLAPTRELATQIQDEAIKFGRSSRVSCTCLYGGAPKGPQLKELERGADIVVATPGRLNDILEMRKIDFRQVSLLVLDEADRMLDMGFEPQIRKIVNEIPPRRQTLMYTATWPKEVRKIASDLLINPVQVNIGSEDLSANKSITQFVEVVPDYLKQRRLDQILQSQERGSKIIIFCSTKKLCDHVARVVGRTFPAAAIHGDKSQIERDSVLNQFRSGKSPVLVATDVAARGLDIRDIRVVINYDFPTGIEDYVHRIGRTGRAGATGLAYTFISEHDCKYAPDLVKVLEGANQAVPPEVRELASRAGSRFPKDRGGPMNHYDSGGSGRGGFGGRGGMREGGFAVRGGMRDRNFGGGREVGFNSLDARGRGGWDRGGRGGPNGRFNSLDARGRGGGRGRGRGRFDSRRDSPDRRSRGRSRSRSSERVRTWDYSRSRSRSYSRSRSRSRSWSRSRSPRRDRSRSRSRSYERYERKPRVSKFDVMEVSAPNVGVLPEGVKGNEVESIDQVPAAVSVDRGHTGAGLDLNNATLQP